MHGSDEGPGFKLPYIQILKQKLKNCHITLSELRFIFDINKVDTKYGNFVLIELMRINIVIEIFLMLKLLYSKSVVGLLQTGFLACPTRMDGPT